MTVLAAPAQKTAPDTTAEAWREMWKNPKSNDARIRYVDSLFEAGRPAEGAAWKGLGKKTTKFLAPGLAASPLHAINVNTTAWRVYTAGWLYCLTRNLYAPKVRLRRLAVNTSTGPDDPEFKLEVSRLADALARAFQVRPGEASYVAPRVPRFTEKKLSAGGYKGCAKVVLDCGFRGTLEPRVRKELDPEFWLNTGRDIAKSLRFLALGMSGPIGSTPGRQVKSHTPVQFETSALFTDDGWSPDEDRPWTEWLYNNGRRWPQVWAYRVAMAFPVT